MGVIAQEIQKEAPEVISTDDKRRLGVCCNSLVGLLLQGIEKQQILIDNMHIYINNMQTQINTSLQN